jgi:hypothetical protein
LKVALNTTKQTKNKQTNKQTNGVIKSVNLRRAENTQNHNFECIEQYLPSQSNYYPIITITMRNLLARNDMDVNEHEKLPNITQTQNKVKEQRFLLLFYIQNGAFYNNK